MPGGHVGLLVVPALRRLTGVDWRKLTARLIIQQALSSVGTLPSINKTERN